GFVVQAEDGIRDFHVTGVQTCALPILPAPCSGVVASLQPLAPGDHIDAGQVVALIAVSDDGHSGARGGSQSEQSWAPTLEQIAEIGRASARERGVRTEEAGAWESHTSA